MHESKTPVVPFIAFEGEMARLHRTITRLVALCAVMAAACVALLRRK